MDKEVIDLGKTERNLWSTFVQLSRFKKINDFIVMPFPYSRLTKIALSVSLTPRKAEEARSEKFNIKTKMISIFYLHSIITTLCKCNINISDIV